jgi:hypothetical protein
MPKNKAKLTLKLDSLNGVIEEHSWPMFYDCTVKRLDVYTLACENFITFIKRQKEIEEFGTNLCTTGIFKDDSLTQVEFRLKKLILSHGGDDKLKNVIKFLVLHRESLEWLIISWFDKEMSRVLSGFVKLKTIKLDCTIGDDLVCDPVANVEHLLFKRSKCKILAKIFPNVKHLTVKKPAGDFQIELFTKLESLTIYESIDADITKSKAKKLTLIHYDGDARPFDFENHNFEEFFVIKRSEEYPKWLKEFVEGGYDTKLKVFDVKTDKFRRSFYFL